jgi:hypothetical protein
MALIFCEGFEDWRTVNNANVSQLPDVWEFISGYAYYFSYSNAGRSGYGSANLKTSAAEKTVLKLKLDIFGEQSAKTLYLGVAIKNLQSAVGATGATLPNQCVTFFNTAGNEVIQISVKKESATDTAMKIVVGQAGTVFAEYALSDFSFIQVPEGADYYIYNGSWVYFEFKIDLLANEFALRANGIPQPRLTALNETTTTLDAAVYPNTISEIAAIQFHGNTNNANSFDVQLDDLYLSDSTGDTLNSWIGPCRILTPGFVNAGFSTAEVWDPAKVSSWPSALTSNDGDTNYVSSGTADKKQLVGFTTTNLNAGAISVSDDEYIAAVQLSTVLRKTNLDTAVKLIYKSATATYHDLSPVQAIDAAFVNYKSQIFVSEKNPATDAGWNLPEIASSVTSNTAIGFGLQIVEPT